MSTCRAITRLSVNIIRWPSRADMRALETEFFEMASFPGVVGCVDGTHIEISAPTKDPSDYINRKGFHSVILQGIANPKLQFIDCYVGEVGSVHDARVFGNSEVGINLAELIPAEFHLLGDCAYPLRVYLLTPFRDNGHLTRRQVTYNKKLSRTRSTVERAFGLLKNRFIRLQKITMLRTDLVPVIVMACCVLHNMLQEDPELRRDFRVQEEDDDDEDPDDRLSAMAVAKCNEIMNRFR